MNTDVVYLSNKFEGAWRDGLIGKVFVTQEWRLEFEFPKTHIKNWLGTVSVTSALESEEKSG